MKRRTPYRKQVTDSVLYAFPEPGPSQHVAVVIKSHGSNLLEVETPAGSAAGRGLAMLPSKFRKLVWVKRGDFVIVDEAAGSFVAADGAAGAVRYMVEHILYGDQVRHLRSIGKWPACFDATPAAVAAAAMPRLRGRAAVARGADGEAPDATQDGPSGAAVHDTTRAAGDSRSDGAGEDGSEGDASDGGVIRVREMTHGRPGELPPDTDSEDDGDDDAGGEAEGMHSGNTNHRQLTADAPMRCGGDAESSVVGDGSVSTLASAVAAMAVE